MSGTDASPPTLAPPADYFPDLLPFHLVIDSETRALQSGKLLARALPNNWRGATLAELFSVRLPHNAETYRHAFNPTPQQLWVCETESGLVLRGSWQRFGEHYFYLCSALFHSLDDVERQNLRLNDFAPHDAAADLLMMLQQHELAMGQLRDLSSKLREKKDLAERASNAKTTFLATMSHEIRTPLNGVLGMLEALTDTQLGAEQRDIVGTMEASSTHLLHIVNDILDFAKLEAGRMEISPQPCHLDGLIRGALAVCEGSASDKSISIRSNIEAAADGHFALDEVRLRQVLVNLIGNAIKFSEPQGRIDVSVALANDKLCFSVRDYGCGIPYDKQAHIFRPFRQAEHGRKRNAEGTGLGLAISRRIVEACDGHIELESEPGFGAEFRFVVPAHPARLAQEASLDATACEPELDGLVLLVEDNAINQKVAELNLDKLGLAHVTVDNGQRAVAATRERDFDLILMDCHMPVMDGLEATRAIRAQGRTLPILALTADVLEEARSACLQAGMDDVLTKPIRREELRARLAYWLGPASSPLRAVDHL
ncbi:MAG: ATP-binding protein [Pseudomonadota bacterium]